MMLSFFILLPLLALLLLNLPPRGLMKKIVLPSCVVIMLIQLALSVSAFFKLWDISALPISVFYKFDLGVDKLSLLLLMTSALVLFTALLILSNFVSEENEKFNFCSLLLLALAGLNGIALVKDIFSLYVFLEIVSISSFVLIAFEKKADSFEGAFKYIILSSLATVLMLTGIGLMLMLTGGTSFETIKAGLAASGNARLAMLAIGVFLAGLFIKGGLVPFHGWLPDAYSSASAPASVFLAGIATKALGIYTLARLVYYIFGYGGSLQNILLFLGALSILIGAFAAISQNNMKRMLAYSSISQIGYIILGVACATPLGFAAGMFHFFNHAVFKSLLFVNAAALEKQTGSCDMDKLGGVAERMPITGATSVIGALSLAGMPPLAGFWSKILIIVALWVAGLKVYAYIAVLASVLTLAYMLYMQRNIFFGKIRKELENIKEAGFSIIIAAIILAAITIGVGIIFPFYIGKCIIQ